MSNDHLKKVCEGVESVLTFKQSDFGLCATHYFELLENGEVDEIDMYIAFKKMEKFVETVLPFIKDQVDETRLSIAYKKHGVSLSTQNGRAFYDYKACNDPIYTTLAERLKEREEMLKKLTSATEVPDEETGEVLLLNPPIKRQGVSVVMRYEKD